MIVRVIFTLLNINIPFFVSWKPYVMFILLACHRWSTNLLDVDLFKENELGGYQIWKLFFVVPVWFMPYFRLLNFVNNEQYGEGEMSRVVVFVSSLRLILHLLFLLWKSVENDQPLLHLSIPCLFSYSLILTSTQLVFFGKFYI